MESKKNPQEKLTPEEFINEHLQNPQSHINKEDIKNLKIGLDTDKNLEKKEEEKLEEIKNGISKNPPGPYSILDEE